MSASESTIEKLARSVRVQKSGLYAMDELGLLMKHITVGNKPIADLIDTSNYNATFTRLTDRLHTETDATMILGISRIMQGIVNNKKHLGLSDETVAYFYDNKPYTKPVTDDYKKQLAIDAIEQGKGILAGVVGSEDLDALKSRVDDIKAIPSFASKSIKNILDRLEEIKVELNGNYSDDEKEHRNSLYSEHNDLVIAYNLTIKDDETLKKDPERLAKAMGGLKLELHEKGKVVIDKLLTASPITHEQANEWVSRQKTSKNVYAALAKKGYPTDKVKADLSEFYRLTHGKLKDVEIVLGGAKRANSKDSNNILAGAIDLGSNPDKRVLFHELAHGLEADALAINLAHGFLIKRRKSDQLISLNKLSGRLSGYDSSEKAYEDDFIDPYVGKSYKDATEVFSMGVEHLANPSKFMELVARDSEHAALILQYLGNESEVLNATKKLTSGVFNDISESNKKLANSFQDEINRLSSSITLYQSGFSISNLNDNQKYKISIYLGTKERNLPEIKYIGSYKRGDIELHIVEGKFKKDDNGRIAKGYAVIYEETEKSNYGTETRLTAGARAVHRALDDVKAVIAYMFDYYPPVGEKLMWQIMHSNRALTDENLSKIQAIKS